MDDVSNNGAVVEPNQLQTDATSPQTESAQGQYNHLEAANSSQVSPDQQDKSWIKKVRRDREDAIRAKEEAERKAKLQEELIRQLMANQQGHQAATEEDIVSQIEKEEYVPGDKVAKALQKQRDDFKKEIEELKKAQKQDLVARQEAEIRSQYSDFEDVVNPDTLDMLKDTNPKLYSRVAKLLQVDPMDGAVFAYESIVGAGIADKIPDARRAKEVEKKIEQNKKTVQSPSSFDKRPIAQAMSFPDTKEARQALWAETLKYASMGGGGY